MITNKDIRVENGNLVLNGDKFPLEGQSPEAIMEIVEDNSDTTPTENSTAPVTSGGVYTALGTKQDTLTFDTVPTDNSTNPVESGGVFTALTEKCDLALLGIYTASSITEALGKAWDDLTVYDKPVLVRFGWQGVNMAIMYKYADSQYGMAMAMKYSGTDIYTMSVSAGAKTYATK